MRRVTMIGSVVVALALIAPPTARSAEEGLPLGIAPPGELSADDLLATTTEGGDVRTPVPGSDACASATPRPLAFPADDGPHNDASYLEWWWWYGEVEAADGRRYGFMIDSTSKPHLSVYGVEFSILDQSAGSFHERREPLLVGRPQATATGYAVTASQATIEQVGGVDHLRLDVDGYVLDVAVQATKPPVLNFDDGHVNLYCNDVYWYTRPRMEVTGTLNTGDEVISVRGSGSFDHMWGFDPVTEYLDWDWSWLQLDDGRDIGLVTVAADRGSDELSLVTGYISAADGTWLRIGRGDFEMVPTRWWQRDATCSYPVGFDVRVLDERFHLEAVHDGGEFRALETPLSHLLWPGYAVFWDGPTRVTGDVGGQGWMDQGGYCSA